MQKTVYTITGVKKMKIALVSDLHEHDPKEVLQILKEENPDIICCAGDILERKTYGPNPKKKENILVRMTYYTIHLFFDLLLLISRLFGFSDKPSKENGLLFLKEASKIAPVYYSVGNHEWYFTEEDKQLFKECQIHLLDNQWEKWEDLLIGGYSSIGDEKWLNDYKSEWGFKILLNHHPEYYDMVKDFDLILSGHAHGGLFQMMGKAIFAPGQGFFPKYYHGIYGKMIVSAGCANTTAIPRINNPCEVVIIHMEKEELDD